MSSRDDLTLLTLALHSLLVFCFGYGVTQTAKIISKVVGVSDRTVREWRVGFVKNCGSLPDYGGDRGFYGIMKISIVKQESLFK